MGWLAHLTGLSGRDIAVDLGTTNTLVYVRGGGIVLSEPSLVAVESRTGDLRAIGIEAERLLEREAGSMSGARRLRDGVITDFDVAAEMLRRFIQKACRSRRAHPRIVVVGVPSGATGVEKRAVEEACLSAGARHAYLIEEPLAAAIGAGLPVAEAAGSLVVDIGGGTSEVALISLGEIVAWQSIRVGGDELDEAIIKHLNREHGLLIRQRTAEEAKLQIGSAFPNGGDVRVEVRGCDTRSALPKTVVLRSEEIRAALERPERNDERFEELTNPWWWLVRRCSGSTATVPSMWVELDARPLGARTSHEWFEAGGIAMGLPMRTNRREMIRDGEFRHLRGPSGKPNRHPCLGC
jgi:rod shape-determining protein MreB and related proteins